MRARSILALVRKSEPSRREKQRLITASSFRFRMEFVIEFDRPISVLKGRETARKLLDALRLHAGEVDVPDGYDSAHLRCAELGRLLKIELDQGEER